MKKTTFLELFLVKYGHVSQPDAERIVGEFAELYTDTKIPEKAILGCLGYIKYAQGRDYTNESAAQYVLKDMERSISAKKAGVTHIPSSQAYWVEMGNDRMPKL